MKSASAACAGRRAVKARDDLLRKLNLHVARIAAISDARLSFGDLGQRP